VETWPSERFESQLTDLPYAVKQNLGAPLHGAATEGDVAKGLGRGFSLHYNSQNWR
jgi:hypothetical protein